jgi:hypothetical protein
MVSLLSIICFMVLLDLDYPANVQAVIRMLFSFINAELLDPEYTTAYVFDLTVDEDFVEQAFVDNFKMFLNRRFYDVGFESYNPQNNLGGLYIYLVFIKTQMAVIIAIVLFSYLLVILRATTQKEGGNQETEVKIETDANEQPLNLELNIDQALDQEIVP